MKKHIIIHKDVSDYCRDPSIMCIIHGVICRFPPGSFCHAGIVETFMIGIIFIMVKADIDIFNQNLITLVKNMWVLMNKIHFDGLLKTAIFSNSIVFRGCRLVSFIVIMIFTNDWFLTILLMIHSLKDSFRTNMLYPLYYKPLP